MKNDDISAAAFHRFISQPASGRSSALPLLAAFLVLSLILGKLHLHSLFFRPHPCFERLLLTEARLSILFWLAVLLFLLFVFFPFVKPPRSVYFYFTLFPRFTQILGVSPGNEKMQLSNLHSNKLRLKPISNCIAPSISIFTFQ